MAGAIFKRCYSHVRHRPIDVDLVVDGPRVSAPEEKEESRHERGKYQSAANNLGAQ